MMNTAADRKQGPTLEQQRAAHAWKCAGRAQEVLKEDYEKYIKLAKGVPALIMNSGLMQVLAFLHEKSLDTKGNPKPNDPHTLLGDHLREALNKGSDKASQEFANTMNKLMDATPQEFQAITTEALAWLKWLRQMAAARNG